MTPVNQTVTASQSVDLSSIFSVSGSGVTQYQVWFSDAPIGAPAIGSVTDNGTGIPDEVAAAPFEAGRRRRTRTGGAGLGLSIAQGIAEAHQGRIELERLPRGTRFRVCLPADVPGDAGEAGSGALVLVPGGTPAGEEHDA